MKNPEFSDMFDTMLNSYALRAGFGEQANNSTIALDEYEKSMLLTYAQDAVVKSFFDRKKNATGDGFDDTTERQVDFSSLITTKLITASSVQDGTFDARGILFDLPFNKVTVREGNKIFNQVFDRHFRSDAIIQNVTDVLFILNERLLTKAEGIDKSYVIVPINYKEYDRIMSKPYAQPLEKQAWRLFQNKNTGFDLKTEIIPRWNLITKEAIVGYKIRYVRRPTPIVLTNLSEGLSIDGVSTASECSLNPIIHYEILQKAVELAAISRGLIKQDRQS